MGHLHQAPYLTGTRPLAERYCACGLLGRFGSSLVCGKAVPALLAARSAAQLAGQLALLPIAVVVAGLDLIVV